MVWWVLQTGSKGDEASHERLVEWSDWGNFGAKDNVIPYWPYTLVSKPSTYRGVPLLDAKGKPLIKETKESLFPKYIFLEVNNAIVAQEEIEEVPKAGRLIKRFGLPVVIREKHMMPLLARGAREGKVAEVDKTKRSFWFKGGVGDAFTFMRPSPFAGFRGWITSTENLDKDDAVMAFVMMFNKTHVVAVPTAHIGSVVRDMSEAPLRAAA
jgi:transcription antitermination factor NusG